MSNKKESDLEVLIKDKSRDHPWFLSGVEGKTYSSLSPAVKARYMKVPKKLSDVEGFDTKVKYVRKDISFWLVGSSKRSLVDGHILQWSLRIVKDLIAGSKIGMVITNPAKIAADNMSNVAYLSVMGVDPMFVQENYRLVSAEFNQYQEKKNLLNNMRIRSYADEKYKIKVEKLEKELAKHPSNGLVKRGFISSLGSELVMQTNDPSSGFKSDIDTALKTVLLKKDGKHNAVGKFLLGFSKFGNIGMENILEILARPLKELNATKVVGNEFDRMAERIRHLKSEDDVITYMHQFLNSPDSEFVKLGSHMTDLTDILARETYYRFLVQKKGMDPKKAELDVIDSFPDYKEGLPTKVKQLSDVGILMFPNYWLRIQKAIYRMAKNRPASFGTEMAVEAYLGVDPSTIWDANIWNKATSFNGLINSPWDNIGVDSLIPRYLS